MREESGSELSPFVTLDDQTGYTKVILDATSSATLSPFTTDVLTLKLESFDDADDVKSTFYRDEVTIYVTDYIRDTPIISDMVITRGDFASFDVDN